jgi:hypothetical protein
MTVLAAAACSNEMSWPEAFMDSVLMVAGCAFLGFLVWVTRGR